MNKESTHPTMIGVGHLCVDILGQMPHYPSENTSNRMLASDIQAGGGASQAAVAYSRLGGASGFIGYLGEDDHGDFLYNGLVEERVDVQYLQRKKGISSFSFACVSSENASRTLFNYHQKLPSLDFNDQIISYMKNSRFIHVDTTHHENALNAATVARSLGIPVTMDASSMVKDNEKNLLLAKSADYFISNSNYPCRLMEDENRERALKQIAQWGQKVVMATLGERGSMAVIDQEIVYFPAYKIKAVDTTGAGDVFHGAFVRALDLGYDLYETVRFASAVSAIKCMSLGGRTGIPDLNTTLRFIEENPFEF